MLKVTKFIFLAFAVFFSLGNADAVQAAVEAHPAGTLVLSGGTVYRITDEGSGVQFFDSAEKFHSHFYSFSRVVPMNAADKAKPVTGAAPWGEGRLFNEGGTIYQVSNGMKHGFASAEIFLSYGFKFSQVIPGQLNMPVGPVVSMPNQAHLPGTFVIDNGTVWMITASGKMGIDSPVALLSWGQNFSNIVPATTADTARANEGLLGIRTGALINDNGTVWVIQQAGKKSFPSAPCFTNFRFNFSMLLSGSTQNYSNLGSTCGPEPSTAYTRATVRTSRGDFSADIMTFNLGNGDIKVVTDTANSEDCLTNCPVKSLATYVGENGGFAAINGTYFCPTAYPECASRTNSFYWKVYNSRLDKMINANNGIKEDMPFIAFKNSQASYFSQYKTYMNSPFGITAGINHEPRLVENGANVLNTNSLDSKELTVKSNRGALGLRGQVVYAVIVRSATIPDLAAVMQALGVDHAMNLDGGGSSSMIYENSYKVGPGRNLPNAIIFVRQ